MRFHTGREEGMAEVVTIDLVPKPFLENLGNALFCLEYLIPFFTPFP
jgi:hypothetical protein